MLSPKIISELSHALTKYVGATVEISSTQSVGGGSINQAYKLLTNHGYFFVKVNSSTRYPGMFEAEEKGLRILRNSNTLYIPKVILSGNRGENAYLILEFVEGHAQMDRFWQEFGSLLAKLHRKQANTFGLDHDNYIGSLLQSNRINENWTDFFIKERLQPQIQMARLDSTIISQFENLFRQLDSIFPEEPPSLLHGDLWSGNYMIGPKGEPCIMDPAVYYGHREMDIAMSRLFGGFPSEFYAAYNEVWPMEGGWEDRLDICNLYPLMVHVNLFGGSYLSQVQSILMRFA